MRTQKIGLVMLVVMIVSATFAYAAGQQGEAGEKKLHIGVAAASFDDKWMSYMHEGFEIAAEEAGVKITSFRLTLLLKCMRMNKITDAPG